MLRPVARWLACLGLPGLLLGAWVAARAANAPAAAPSAELTAQVKSGTPQAKQQAVAAMLEAFKNDPESTLKGTSTQWLNALKAAKMHAELAQVSAAAIEAAEKTADTRTPAQMMGMLRGLWNQRITALIDAGQAREAVEALLQVADVKVGNQPLKPAINGFVRTADALVAEKAYDQAGQAALAGLLQGSPDVLSVINLQRTRTLALLEAGKADAALSAAKGFYNVCYMHDTAEAIELLARCLAAARKDDPEIALRLKAQQVVLAATTRPSQAALDAPEAASVTSQSAAGPNVLGTIPSEAKLFEKAIAAIPTPSDFNTCMAKGNLLLLADRGKEARECFQAATGVARDDGQLAAALEGVARAIRTSDRGVGGANAYILSLKTEK